MTYKPVGVNESSQFPPRVETHIQTKIDTAISALINGAPGALDTLKELADQLASDESATAALTTGLATKASITSLNTEVSRASAAEVALQNLTNSTFVTGLNDAIVNPAQTLVRHTLASGGDEPGAVVVFSPDDGYTQQVADIAVINARGYPASLNLTRGFVGLAGTSATWGDTYITQAQVQAIVNHAAGNEITYHDNTDHKSQVNQYNSLGAAGLAAYVDSFKAWALTTFGVTVKTGAYPSGASDERVREVMGRSLDFMRGTKGKTGDYANDPFDTPGVDILTLTLSQITAYIDTAISKRSVVSLLWHGGADSAFRTKLGQVIDYCEAHNVPIQTYYKAMSERTAWRGQSGAIVDRQGNAFLKTTRTRRMEFGRGDSLGDSIWMQVDLVNNAGYMDGNNGRPFEFRNTGLRVLGTSLEAGRQQNYSGTTTSGSPTITAITGFSADNSIIGVGVSGTGIPAGAQVGSYGAASVTLVTSDGVTPVNATASGTVTITFAFPTNPVAKFFNRAEFHNGARVVGSAASTGYSIYDLTGTQTALLTASVLKRLASGTFTIDTSGGNLELEAARVRMQPDGGTAYVSFAPALPTDASIDNGETVIYPDPTTGTLLYKGKSAGGTVFGPSTLARTGKRVLSTADTATLTIDANSYDAAKVTALAQTLTIAAPTGSPTAMQTLIIRIKDNGTAQGLAWNAAFRAVGTTLPTTTVLGKVLYVGAMWNSDDSKWDVIAVAQQA